MLNRVSNWQVGQWLDDIMAGGSYAGLVQSEPTETDVTSVEVYGDGYRRQVVSWRKAGRSLVLAGTVTFSGIELPMGIAGLAVFTSMTGGTIRATGMLPEKVTLVTASSFTLGPGEIVLNVS
jgi:hypothetical protein